MTCVIDFNNNWTDDPEATIRRAYELADKAVGLGPNNPYAYTVLATAAAFNKDRSRSRVAIDKALELSPNDANALFSRGAAAIITGDPTEGIRDVERARRLNPAGSDRYLHFLGLGHILLGKYETAVVYFKERILTNPETDLSRSFLASTLGHLGRLDEARQVWADLMKVNPDYSFAVHRTRVPFADPAAADRIAEGLKLAGLPA
jgi:adenylate cyclase